MNKSNKILFILILFILDRIYQALLTAYPAGFRAKYGGSMNQVFRDRCREEFSRKGNWGLVRLSFHTFFDFLASLAKERADQLAQDVRYGSRMLIKTPGFTTMAVIALALGIGANSAIFNALSASLLPLPYHEPDRLELAWEFAGTVSPTHYADWQRYNQAFEQMAPFSWDGIDLTGEDKPEYLVRGKVSATFFSLLGVKASIGRTFLPEDEQPGKKPVAVLSHDLWQRRYHSSPRVIGNFLRLNGENTQIIGVMPANFRSPGYESFGLWTSLTLDALSAEERQKEQVMVLARLKPGITREAAKTDLERISKQLGHQLQKQYPADGIQVYPLSWPQNGMFRDPAVLVILQISVALMLVLACANVSGLLLARAAIRQREMGIRTELGGSRARLIRQLLTESLLLALMGGVLGLLLAWGITHLLANALSAPFTELPLDQFGSGEISMNGRMLGFTLLVTLLTGLVFGLTPAFLGTKAKPEALQQGRWQWKVTFPRQHIHSLLVVIEVAVALVLLTRAALEVQGALRKPEYRPGLNPSNVLIMEIHLPESEYSGKAHVVRVCGQILQTVQNIPGVKSVGVTGRTLFLGGSNFVGVFSEPLNNPGPRVGLPAFYGAVNPAFLSTMRIPLQKAAISAIRNQGKVFPRLSSRSTWLNASFQTKIQSGRESRSWHCPMT